MSALSSLPPSGHSRSLTEVFILLRNNAIQSRQIFNSMPPRQSDDRVQLMTNEDVEDAEPIARTPPEWISVFDELQYELGRVKTRMKELKDMQQSHLNRPSFSDESGDATEKKIDGATTELTRMLNHCNQLVKHIQQYERTQKSKDAKMMLRNTVTSLLVTVQNLTEELRNSQSAYLRKIKSRDDSVQQYFSNEPDDVFKSSNADPWGDTGVELTMQQIQMIEDNEQLIKQREKDVLHITKSIIDLNLLFKDVAGLISEQGTILDRIDYNIEQTDIRVKKASANVKQAEKYQRGNRKMLCILILAMAILFFLVLIIFT